ncbi:FAD-binding domain-containing protein [Xylariaceae sp. FL0255]|nr:FAD-binding domain-containing protein [Xylariaceae sp. FL0255]
MPTFSTFLTLGLIPFALGTHPMNSSGLIQELGSQLSSGASISAGSSTAPRWSDYAAPEPGYTVTVAEEQDVVKTIQYCNEKGINFLAQSGAHSSPTTFHIGSNDIVINLRGINFTTVGADGTMNVGAGALNSDIIEAAYESGGVVLNGGCNCVGASGLNLGGGLSLFMGEYGMPIDNLISLNMVAANGTLVTTSKTTNPDLFWALAGAGPNFGVVTSFVIKTHSRSDLNVWGAELFFTGDQLEAYIDTMNNLNLTEKMVNNWQLLYSNNTPYVVAGALYLEPNDTAAREAFKPLFDIGPVSYFPEILAYNHINDASDDFCIPGGRKPSWHVGLKSLDYPTWQVVWDAMVAFVDETGLNSTRVLVETYSNYVAREIGSEYTSYPHRAINYHAVFQSIYNDSSWDSAVDALGTKVRDLWRSTDGFDIPRTYINFAHGDEEPEIIYGEGLPKLRELKAAWDPRNKFNQWLPIM